MLKIHRFSILANTKQSLAVGINNYLMRSIALNIRETISGILKRMSSMDYLELNKPTLTVRTPVYLSQI